MESKPTKLPELKVLKELLKEDSNIVWYSRQGLFEGSEESLKYLKKKIKKFKQKREKKNEDELLDRDNFSIL